MTPTKTAVAAARAAMQAAARLGVACAEPVVLADGANVIVHLSPSPVVAKVAASTRQVRADPGAWLQRELDVAGWLHGTAIPVAEPSPQVPATVHHGDGQVMSFWRYLPPAGDRRPDEGTFGSMLRDLHLALRAYPQTRPALTPPPLAPLQDIPAFLARPQTQVSPESKATLAAAYARLTAELDRRAAAQVLHGDAGLGNVLPTDGRRLGLARLRGHLHRPGGLGPGRVDGQPAAGRGAGPGRVRCPGRRRRAGRLPAAAPGCT